jgi:hypothetical protein
LWYAVHFESVVFCFWIIYLLENLRQLFNCSAKFEHQMVKLQSDRATTEIGFTESFDTGRENLLETANPHRGTIYLFLASYLWTLILTGVPLAFTVGPVTYYANHPDWYTGDDVMRFLEPVGGMLFNFMILYKSGVFKKELDWTETVWVMMFFLGAALYEQGAGFHSASNMFKNAMQTIDYDDRDMTDLYFWMRTIWEHIISHYIYAVGYAIMTAVQCYLYREYKSPQNGLDCISKVLLVLASLTFALLIAGVAADFQSGLIVAIVYLVLYGFCVVGGYVFYVYHYLNDKTVAVFGSRPILHHFLLSYVIAFVLVILYIASVGGLKNRHEAGIQ